MKWRNGVDKLGWAGRNEKERARRGRVGIYINEIGIETSPAYSKICIIFIQYYLLCLRIYSV